MHVLSSSCLRDRDLGRGSVANSAFIDAKVNALCLGSHEYRAKMYRQLANCKICRGNSC